MLQLKILTPEKEIFDSTISQVNVPTKDGEIGILPDHAALMATIVPGALKIKQANKDLIMAIGDGLLMVNDNQIKILTDMAQEPANIDEKKIEEAKKRAEQALEQTLSDEEYALTLATIEKLSVALKVKRHHHNR